MHPKKQYREAAPPPVKTNEERALDALFLLLVFLIVFTHWMKP